MPRESKVGVIQTGHGGRCRQAARDAGMSGGGWREAGAGDVQVDGASRRERMWGAGAIQMSCDVKRYLWGAVV